MTKDVDLKKLNQIFQSVMKKQVDKIDPIRSKFGRIEKEEISLDARISCLERYAKEHKKFSFRDLLEKQGSRTEIVVTFLAVLELMKVGKICIVQEHLFDEIMIKKFSFRDLLEKQGSRTEIVVTFLAVLELMKVGKICIVQEHLFDEIMIESKIERTVGGV